MTSLYKTYRKAKLADGGGMDYMSLIQSVAAMGNAVVDATAKPDPVSGRTSILDDTIKGEFSMEPLGPTLALLKGLKEKMAAGNELKQQALAQNLAEKNNNVGLHPELLEGYKNSGYYAFGGPMDDGGGRKKSKLNSTVRTPFNRYSAQIDFDGKTGNFDPDKTMKIMASFMRNNMPPESDRPSNNYNPDWQHTSFDPAIDGNAVTYAANGGSIHIDPANKGKFNALKAKTGKSTEELTHSSNPLTRKRAVFAQNASHWNKKANGGEMTKFAETGTDISAPIARMFMSGGKAKPLSSDNAIMVGKSHAEGGIDIPEMNAEVEGGETTKGDYVFSKRLGFAGLHKPIAMAKGKIEAKPLTPDRVNALKLLSGKEDVLRQQQELLKSKLGVQ